MRDLKIPKEIIATLLRHLQLHGHVDVFSKVSVKDSSDNFHVRVPGNIIESKPNLTLDMLYSRVKEQETNQKNQVSVPIEVAF